MMKSDLKNVTSLVIKLHDREIGIVNRLAGDQHVFSFTEDYINDPNRHTLSLFFKGKNGDLITSTRPYNLRLPPFFSNLLPEGHLRTYLAERAQVKPEKEFFLLSALGADLPGALTAALFTTNNALAETQHIFQNNIKKNIMRFSLAGIQLKFSAILEASGGLTIPANGINGSWIVKLPSARFTSVPENEFVMLALARAIGIHVPNNYLIDIKKIHGLPSDIAQTKGKGLAVKRFDRDQNGQRIHMEDFAQVFGLFPENKYERRSYANIATVLWAETTEADTFEFVRRLIFSVLIGNADMHLKNWSLLYPNKKTAVLSPAYDLVATLPYIANDKLGLTLGGSRSLETITADQIRKFTTTASLPEKSVLTIAKDTIERTHHAWKTLTEKDLLTNDLKKAIDQQIKKVVDNSRHL